MLGKTSIVKATEAEVREGLNGGCRACGVVVYGGVEPDAAKYECESCGEPEVFGLEELVLRGELHLLLPGEDSFR